MVFHGQDRATIKAAQRALAERRRRYPAHMTPVPRDEWPALEEASSIPVLGVWCSREHLAVAYDERPGEAVRLTVSRLWLANTGHFVDGISWNDLQRIKNECGFAEKDAIEMYPAAVDVVDVANLRHLWILPAPCPLAWRKDQ